jgi:hypothetical protein
MKHVLPDLTWPSREARRYWSWSATLNFCGSMTIGKSSSSLARKTVTFDFKNTSSKFEIIGQNIDKLKRFWITVD